MTMSDLGTKTALVFDHGLFLPLAVKLSESFGRVLYHTPFERGFPHITEGIIGDGYKGIERCNDIWSVKNDVDLWVFPDIQHAGLQLELESQGKLVWGSRKGDEIEISRALFIRTLREQELPVAPFRAIRGMTNLREHLMSNNDRFIKISRWRGTMETWHHHNYRQSEPMLDQLSVKLGAAKDIVLFLVIEPVETDLEVGYDGYCVDGQFPSIALQGYESKDMAFIAAVQPYDDLPEQVKLVNEKFGPVLGKYRYRNFFSTEIRIKDDVPYFIDPCCRCPSPSTEAQIELYGNLGDILWAGAHGECIDPEPVAKFAAEVVVSAKESKRDWVVIDAPQEVLPWLKCGSSCDIDGRISTPPDGTDAKELGWLVGIGDTIQEAIDAVKEHAEFLSDCPVTVNLEPLAQLVSEIQSAEEQGIEFTDQTVPEPETVLKS